VDVEKVLDSTINVAMSHIRPRAQLVRDYQPLPPVHADDSRLGQVFLNLLVNAAQAIPEGAASANRIVVRTRQGPSGEAIVEVEDTGTGIEPWKMDRIFEPFWTDKPVGVGNRTGPLHRSRHRLLARWRHRGAEQPRTRNHLSRHASGPGRAGGEGRAAPSPGSLGAGPASPRPLDRRRSPPGSDALGRLAARSRRGLRAQRERGGPDPARGRWFRPHPLRPDDAGLDGNGRVRAGGPRAPGAARALRLHDRRAR